MQFLEKMNTDAGTLKMSVNSSDEDNLTHIRPHFSVVSPG